MGIYLNPGSDKFRMSMNGKIYIDKSGLIAELNPLIETEDRFVCVSRPRRFGKTMAANMLAAYYGCDEDTSDLFSGLSVSDSRCYKQHLNQHMVIQLNMQSFLSENDCVTDMLADLQSEIINELKDIYPEIVTSRRSLPRVMEKIYSKTRQTFIILIDEWDCLFREYKGNDETQKMYLDFLRNWLKDKTYVGLAYMTGILPIKKYGTHSALNMFNEFSMVEPGGLAVYFGFMEWEVRGLCERYKMDFDEVKAWYDGYTLGQTNDESKIQPIKQISIYSPQSVVEAMKRRHFSAYWNQTETYEALQLYMDMNFDGLKDAIIEMLAGAVISVDTGTFINDMTTFKTKDDVLTLLIHLGYLTYNAGTKSVAIPNKEVSQEYINSIKTTSGWSAVAQAVEHSRNLLQSLWEMDEAAVAEGIDRTHEEVSMFQYNDENALSYTISLAFYYAREYYTLVRELPSGKGYADICFIPRRLYPDKPALLVELKWNKSAKSAMDQIKERNYPSGLSEYKGNLILAGINYDKGTKRHECIIEKIVI